MADNDSLALLTTEVWLARQKRQEKSKWCFQVYRPISMLATDLRNNLF